MSENYVKMLDHSKAKRSVSYRGDCYDNAVAESAFGSLKQEMVYLENVFETREKGRIKILKYINWYNSERLHSTIGYVSPNDFEKGNVTKVVA